MKKLFFIVLLALTGPAVWAQSGCDTISTFPWVEHLDSNFNCWLTPGSSPWTYNPWGGDVPALYSYTPSSVDRLAASPVIALPIDIPDMQLHWRIYRSWNTPTFHVMVTTDMVNFDTLYTCNHNGSTGADSAFVSLNAYAGQAVRVVFCVPTQTTRSSFYITKVEVYSNVVPRCAIEVSHHAVAIGDTVTFTAHLTRGNSASPTFSWNSQMAAAGLVSATAADSVLTVVYSVPGIDTVTVTASNMYGSSAMEEVVHVYDCAVTLPWCEDFMPVSSNNEGRHTACWNLGGWQRMHVYYPSGLYHEQGHIVDKDYFMGTYTNGDYMISPAIPVPTSGAEHLALWVESIGNLNLRISTLGDSDTSLFNDTLVIIPNMNAPNGTSMLHWTMLNLSSYAGQTIHVMLQKRAGNKVYVNTVAVTTERPLVHFTAPATVVDTATAVYTATQIHCLNDTATFTWRSAFVDAGMATATMVGDTFLVDYIYGGIDTITVIATNAYGADTAVRTVTVIQCNNRSVPFEEDFSSLDGMAEVTNGSHISIPSAYLYSDQLPDCWAYSWGGNYQYRPHVVDPTLISQLLWMQHVSSKALLMEAGAYSGYDTVAYVVLPGFALPLQQLVLAVDHLKESNVHDTAHGILTAGYMQDGVFTAVADLTDTNRLVSDIVSFASVPAADAYAHIALRWICTSVWWGTAIERIEVIPLLQDSLPPSVTLQGPATVQAVTDTAHFTATLRYGDTTGLTFNWHSSLLDTTFNGPATLSLVYPLPGTDTITVVATNNYGVDTARTIVQVLGLPEPTIIGPASVYSDEEIIYSAQFTSGSATCVWHSMKAARGEASLSVHNSQITITYFTGGRDTLTLTATNIFGSTTVSRTVNVTGCHINSFPWDEGFETSLSGCWHIWTNSTDERMHSWSRKNDGSYYAYNGSGYMFSQNLTLESDTTRDYLILPPIDLPDNQPLNLYYHVCTYYMSDLWVLVSTTGRNPGDFTDTLHFERSRTWTHGSYHNAYVARSLSLANYMGQTIYVSFVTNGGVQLDDLSIAPSGIPEVYISGPTQLLSCDEAVFVAHWSTPVDTTSLTYTWHSTMADAGLATMTVVDDTARIEYHAGGRDTVSVVVANATGSDTATQRCQVTDCEPITQFPYSVVLNSRDNLTCWATRNTIGGDFGTYSSWELRSGCCMSSETSWSNDTADAWLISQELSIPNDATLSYTLQWHVLCDHSKYQVLASTSGRSTLEAFTDTLFYESHDITSWATRSVSLDAYRGQHVYIAFRSQGWVNSPAHYYDVGVLRIDTVGVTVALDTTPVVPPVADTIWRTVTVTANVSGACEPYGSGRYVDSSMVEIGYYVLDTATMGGHWQFLGWSDGPAETPRNILVTSDTTIVALFEWVDDSIGIEEMNNSNLKVEIYPNPAHSDVTISIGQPSTVSVLDVNGRTALPPTKVVSSLNIPHTLLKSGVYLVKVTTDTFSMVKKLIVK